jgi:signal transduction histidine kinase
LLRGWHEILTEVGNAEDVTLTPLPHERHWSVPVWLTDLVIGCIVVVSAFVPFGSQAHAPGSPGSVSLLVVAALILPLRRRFGLAVLGVTLAIFVAGALFSILSPAFILPVAVATYRIGCTRSTRDTAIIATAVWAVVMTASWSLLPVSWFDARIIQQIAVIAFAAALGAAMQSRRAYIAAITERALRAEQTRDSEARRQVAEERLRIARDLHDAVAHQIAVINLHAGVASQALPERPGDAERSLATIREAARSVLSEISDLLRVLRSEPTGAALDPERGSFGSLRQLDELVQLFGLSGLTVRVHPESGDRAGAGFGAGAGLGADTGQALPPEIDDVAYRVVYEALTNAHKHGLPQVADVRVSVSESAARPGMMPQRSLVLCVENPVLQAVPTPGLKAGSKAVPDAATQPLASVSGHGLIGMRERLSQVGGSLSVATLADGGSTVFQLTAVLPLESASAPTSRTGVPA